LRALRRSFRGRLAVQDRDMRAGLQLVLSVDHDLLVGREAGVDESLSVADLRDGNRPELDGVVGIDDVSVGDPCSTNILHYPGARRRCNGGVTSNGCGECSVSVGCEYHT
jgi:hypothetical protein